MTTHFITAEVDLQKTPIKLKEEIEKQLQKEGEILRWAVTNVDSDQQKAQVEAIVTR
jgi:ribosomal protein S6